MRKIKYRKLNIILSTLNFVLMFVGYQLATSLFLPVSSDMEGISRMVTVPYRAFALLISLLVILLNLKKRVRKTPLALKVLWVYWFALIIRIFYDTNIRIDVSLRDTTQLWLYVFGIILPAMISVMKSIRMIDFDNALKWVFLGTVVTLILSLFNNSALLMDTSEITGRASGNLAFNSISFGHLGTMGVVLSLFLLSKQGVSLIKKILIVVIMLLSFFIMLRAGSRSPILALAVILVFWLFVRGKNIVLGVSIAAIAVVLMFVFMDPILNFMGNISPVIEYRLRASIYEGDTSARDPLYDQAFRAFLDHPIIGSQFGLFNHFGGFFYSHNIILDSLMGLGLFGGVGMIYILWIALKKSYQMIKMSDPHFWISLILVQQIVLSMLSGAIYYNQILNVLLVFVFLYTNSNAITYNKSLHYV
jgi:O-antigen ligase